MVVKAEEEPVLEAMLALLNHRLQDLGVQLPNAKCKKMISILKFLGVNKN